MRFTMGSGCEGFVDTAPWTGEAVLTLTRPSAARTTLSEVISVAQRDIAFDAEGVTLRGWFFPAEGTRAPGAAVVMAHGFSAVKEMYLDRFAEAFAAAGLNVVVFDNRCFGASDGKPRQHARGGRSPTTGTPLPTPVRFRRWTTTGSASGARATAAPTCWSSPQ